MRDQLYASPFCYFQLAQKLDVDSYHGYKVIAVPFMPWFFLRASCFKCQMKFGIRMLLYILDYKSFRQDHGKSKFAIYISLYNVPILCYELQYMLKSCLLPDQKKCGYSEIRHGDNISAPAKEARLAELTRAGVILNVINRVYGCFSFNFN